MFRNDEGKENEVYKHLEKGLIAVKKTNLFLNGVHISCGSRWDYSELDENKRD